MSLSKFRPQPHVRALFAAALLGLLAACTTLAPQSPTVKIKLIAFNDFHGNLEAPHATIRTQDKLNPERDVNVPAGGAAEFATLVQTLRAENPNNALVAAGDVVGATPIVSSLFLDEPTLEAMNMMRLDFTSVGNHEFDRGIDELKRKQYGGCEKFTEVEPCRAGHRFEGSNFPYLAANVIDRKTGKTIFPAYGIKKFDGVPIAFIGLTLKGTPDLVSPEAIASVDFLDEADTINGLLPELRAQGVKTFVVLIHQGGYYAGRFNDRRCLGLDGDILPILDRLDPAISLVISGHTHQSYVCDYQGRLLTSAASYSRLLTDIDLEVDRATGQVIAKSAINRIVTSDAYDGTPLQPGYVPLAKDPAMDAHVQRYVALAGPLANRPVGRITETLTRGTIEDPESALGDVVADSQLEATRGPAGAQLALMNPGGIRTDLDYENGGALTYGALFRSQPFGNGLLAVTLTGAQIKATLEQQWLPNRARPQMLRVSKGFSYAFDLSRPMGQRVIADSIKLDGKTIDPDARYRVTINAFLGAGGDGFTVLLEGKERQPGMMDVDALEAYAKNHSPIAPPKLDRVLQR